MIEQAFQLFKRQNKCLWIYHGEERFVSDLLDFRKKHFDLVSQAHNQNIALYIRDIQSLAYTLLLLNGVSRQLLLIPTTISPEIVDRFLTQTQSTIIVSDVSTVKTNLTSTVHFYDLHSPTRSISFSQNASSLETQWILTTSGTTATPKLVPHTLFSLTKTMKMDTELGDQFRWGLLYSITRFAGLQVFFQSLVAGSTLILTNEEDPIESRIEELIEGRCNALSATPTMWRKMLMVPNSDRLQLKQATLGGEIADDPLLKALRKQFPESHLTHIYASTEAGVCFSVSDGKAGFPASYLESPLPNRPKMKVSKEGFLLIKLPDQGYYNSGDLVEKKGERFYFLGRADGIINVGGHKVTPEEVEKVLLSFPGVLFAQVSAKKSSITGSLVIASVVIDKNIKERKIFEKKLLDHCRKFLDNYKVPAFVKFVDSIDFNEVGKLRRNG